MFCVRCRQTDVPDLRIAGSDRAELAAWCCLLLPGLLYCVWRHANRRRICAHCGSSEILRESRAARRRRKAVACAPAREPQVIFAAPRIAWLAMPAVRLRRALRGGALVAAFAGFAVASIDTVEVSPAPAPDAMPSVSAQPAKLHRATRRRECEKLCLEFHRTRLHGHSECLERCVERFDADALATVPAVSALTPSGGDPAAPLEP
jgi:hypothetical protein